MMSSESAGSPDPEHEVVTTVLAEFMAALAKEPAIDSATLERLREALLKKREFSVDALRAAFFADDTLS